MCVPMAAAPMIMMAASAAASAAGSIASSSESAARTGAMGAAKNQSTQQQMQLQNGLSDQAFGVLNPLTASMSAPQEAQNREGFANTRMAAMPTVPQMPITVGGAPPTVNAEIGRLAQKTSDMVSRNAAAKANLASYGDAQHANSINMQVANDKIGNIVADSQRQSGAFPAVLGSNINNAAAAHMSPLGGILKGAGSLLGMGGSMMGAGGAAGSAGTPVNADAAMSAWNAAPSWYTRPGM